MHKKTKQLHRMCRSLCRYNCLVTYETGIFCENSSLPVLSKDIALASSYTRSTCATLSLIVIQADASLRRLPGY